MSHAKAISNQNQRDICAWLLQNHLSSDFRPSKSTPWNTEHGVEFNVLLNVGPTLLQPVVQYFANAGGSSRDAVVVGFRTKVEF